MLCCECWSLVGIFCCLQIDWRITYRSTVWKIIGLWYEGCLFQAALRIDWHSGYACICHDLQFCAGTVYYLTSHYCYISMHNSFWERKTNSILENSIKIDQIIYSRVVSACWICWRSLCSVLCFLDIIMSIGFSQWISRHSLVIQCWLKDYLFVIAKRITYHLILLIPFTIYKVKKKKQNKSMKY